MAHLRDDLDARFEDGTELVDSPTFGGASTAPSSPFATGYDVDAGLGDADALTTPLLQGEARHVAQRRKSGRHRRPPFGAASVEPSSVVVEVSAPVPATTPDASHAPPAMRAAPPCGDLIRSATAKRVAEGRLSGEWLRANIPEHAHISDLLTSSSSPAIVPVDDREPLSHAKLRELIWRTDDDLKSWGVRQPGCRVGVAVPNGPELMSVLLSVMERHTAVPVNPATTPQEMYEELRACGVVALVYQGGSEVAPEMLKLCGRLGIVPLAIAPDPHTGGGFSLTGDPYRTEGVREASERGKDQPETPTTSRSSTGARWKPDGSRVALVLHTSGSTGKKKVVPITQDQLVLGSCAIAASSGMVAEDVCLNFMPLFHVGGICRNLLAPLLAGGSTVAMPFFDASDFWTTAIEKRCTWYYGAPTMHLLVVNSAQTMPGGAPETAIRFVANAAGPLLPTVAMQLRDVFPGAAVLTSYGMTECMPITCPPPGYALERAGSSGQAICPDVAIVDDAGEQVRHGRVAHIVVRGAVVTSGYENDPAATEEAFFPGGWFKTGDMGWMDADGYLYVTGRSKEVINRGGEIISPAEVEEALLSHPGVSDVVAISVPHATLQETVGVVVVTTKGIQDPGLRQLCQHASDRLPPAKWPQCLVLVEKIPRIGPTGKISRSAIAKTLDLAEISDGMSELDVTFEADLTVGTGRKGIATREEATSRVAAALSNAPGVEDASAVVDTTGTNAIIGAVCPATADAVKVMSYATRCLPGFLEPKEVIAVDAIPRGPDGKCDAQALLSQWKAQKANDAGRGPLTSTQRAVAEAWAETLRVDARTVGLDDDFFQVGGSSIVAGQLAAEVRRRLSANLTGADIFRYRTVEQIAAKVDKDGTGEGGAGGKKDGKKQDGLPPSLASKPMGSMDWTHHYSPTSVPSLIMQSLPLLVFQPMQKILRWIIFLNTWSFCIHMLHPMVNIVHDVSNTTFIASVVRMAGVDPDNEHFHHLRLCAFFAALLITALISTVIFPLLAVAFKWVVLGKLKPGHHPLWGQYYIRWWLANKAVRVSGHGLFGLNDDTYRLFLRMMGAKVGRGAKIGRHVRIADFDMLDIHENATVDDYAHLRAAEVRRGALRVAPVYVGADAAVCTRAVVGPGGSVPAGATLGPYMSWRELDVHARGVAAQMEEHRKIARMRQPQPSIASQLMAWPLVAVAEIIAWAPWVFVFVVLIRSQGLYLSIPGEEEVEGRNALGNDQEVSFAANPAAYIKKWLGHYTGAEATGLDVAPAMVPYASHVTAKHHAGRSLLSASTDRRFPHLIIERGEYMRRASSRDADLDVSRARLGLGLGESPESEMMTMAPHRVGESIFSPREPAVITDDDGKPVPDEEGGGSMPKGGQVHSFYYGDPLFEVLDKMTWKDCISWFMDPFRLAVIFCARIGHNIFGPLLQMAFVILVKRTVVGKFKPGPLPRTYLAREWELTRRWIMGKMLPTGDFRGALGVLGKHYDYTTYLYRALGAKIGKRVFWPGSGVFVGDGMFDLLEVGDDVVWGSRSLVFPGDGISAEPVKIGRGGNVSDRCVLYAGATLHEDACLGSGSVAPRKSRYEVGSIWVGSRNGSAVALDPGHKNAVVHPSEEREAKPFGRAVYERKANYFLPYWQTMPLIFSGFIALRTAYAVVPIWVSWYVVAVITWDLGNNFWTEMAEWRYLLLLVFVYLWVHMMHTVARFIFDTGVKWILIGKRKPGLYPWDKSSYCLRWKLFESLCGDSLHDLRLIGGSAFLPFFYNNLGSKIGRRVCLYPMGADPPMVEPDLVVIEDDAAVNYAHIICHTNTLGSFALNHIVIRSGATLSTESRVMGGVVIGEDSVLLEHTLAMVGDVVEPGDIWQGWPVQAIAKAEDIAEAASAVSKKAAAAKTAPKVKVLSSAAASKAYGSF